MTKSSNIKIHENRVDNDVHISCVKTDGRSNFNYRYSAGMRRLLKMFGTKTDIENKR